MKKDKEIKLMTVGKIIRELTEFEKKHSEDDVACCLPDDSMGYVVGTELDEDGDACVFLDETYEDSGCYNVEMLCNELQDYDQKACIYMKGCGLLLSFEDCNGLFEYNEDEDAIFCSGIKIGKYKQSHQRRGNSWLTEAEIREKEEEERRQKVTAKYQTIALAIFTLCMIVGFIYKVYAIITHSGAMWENILWGVTFLFCSILFSCVLYSQRMNRRTTR